MAETRFPSEIESIVCNQLREDTLAKHSKIEKLEDALFKKYKENNSPLIRAAVASLAAERLTDNAEMDLALSLDSIGQPLKKETERAIITINTTKRPDRLMDSLSYFLTPASLLGPENDIVVTLVGFSYSLDPFKFSEIVAAADPGPKRDAILFQMAIRMDKNDPEASRGWIDLISDQAVKSDALRRFLSDKPLSKKYLPQHFEAPDPFALPEPPLLDE